MVVVVVVMILIGHIVYRNVPIPGILIMILISVMVNIIVTVLKLFFSFSVFLCLPSLSIPSM